MRTINPNWVAEIESKIFRNEPINEITRHNIVAQNLIILLVKYNIPYKLTNCGAGVKQITTEVTCCPLCKTKK